MKKIKTEAAVGMILCHDLTKIVPGEFKGVGFKKGHVVKEDDIPALLSMGKDHLYVWEDQPGLIHEDEAGQRLAEAINKGDFQAVGPKEGKVDLISIKNGLLRIDAQMITEWNMLGEIAISTLPDYSSIRSGDKVASMRVIPLAVKEEKVAAVEKTAATSHWTMKVVPFQIKNAGMIVTGNEVYYGRITDKFSPKVERILAEMGVELTRKVYVPDRPSEITKEIINQAESGQELILVSGGMSVDPDDATPGAINATGANIVTYGTPVFPGAMFMLAYLGDATILGLPGCVMYSPATAFDKFLPRVLAKETITKKQIVALGVGGLCRDCDQCHFPNCSFGVG